MPLTNPHFRRTSKENYISTNHARRRTRVVFYVLYYTSRRYGKISKLSMGSIKVTGPNRIIALFFKYYYVPDSIESMNLIDQK